MPFRFHITFRNSNDSTVRLPGSKSESNRVLIINALSGGKCSILNLSEAADTKLLKNALSSTEDTVNVMNAGTSMRFLIAYFSAIRKNIIISGNERMTKRPVEPLVDALQFLGADIEYLKNDGYPPVKINEKKSFLKGGKVKVAANISSQFISALLLIAPTLNDGLCIELDGNIASKTYIEMTLSIMKQFGIEYSWTGNTISVKQQEFRACEFTVESDWTSASYWYSIIALSKNSAVFLEGLKRNSFQGDSIISKWAEAFGVVSEFSDNGVFLTKEKEDFSKFPRIIDFTNYLDLAQTLIPLFAATGIECRFKGLENLRIKETDRIAALQNELKKFNIHLTEESEDVYAIQGNFNKNVFPTIETYNDHRMAMSFAPLSMICKGITITNPDCVFKSYPGFWNDLESAGFKIEKS
ncbi:MAG: 3-phosphoshikimate 1-carboxyvinyltransferase [Bacteroidota bacterium]